MLLTPISAFHCVCVAELFAMLIQLLQHRQEKYSKQVTERYKHTQ